MYVIIIGVKKYSKAYISVLTFLWYRKESYIMIKNKFIIPYKYKLISNNAECSTAAGLYCTEHELKVPFSIP